MIDNAASSRVLTLVFTDLADSTALKTERGDVAVGGLIARHREHVTRLAEECTGRIVDWAGDGCFLTFETSSAGVMFALRLQQAHADNPDLPGVRIGIHMGEVSESATADGRVDVNGLAVDLASRICNLAKPGQVLLSSSVYHSARQRMGVDTIGKPILWQAHGTYALKGFDEPLDISEAALEGLAPLGPPVAGDKAKLLKRARRRRGPTRVQSGSERSPAMAWAGVLIVLLVIALAVLLWRQFQPDGAGTSSADPAARDSVAGVREAPITSIAVLPLDNLMNDPEQDYFADGMTEAITAELAKISSLKVISRTSVMRYKDTLKPLPEIAAELGVEGLIEGSVLRDGDEVRITVQLIDAATDSHLWSESYTDTITSILELQSKVALAIVEEIRVALTPDERSRIETAREVDPEAYNLFLQAESGMTDFSPLGLQRVRILLDRAIEIDPEFPEAWARLATANIISANLSLGSRSEYFEQAHRAASRAVELDPGAGRPHAELAFIEFLRDQDWDGARSRLASATALEPNAPSAHIVRAYFNATVGHFEAGSDSARRALELDPFSPFNAVTAGLMLVVLGHPDEGLPVLDAMAERQPGDVMVQYLTSVGYSAAERIEDSLRAADQFVMLSGSSPLARVWQCVVLAIAGRLEEARTRLEAIERTVSGNMLSGTNIAVAYARIGDIDKAIEWLRVGAADPNFQYLLSLRVIPYVGSHLDDPNIARLRTDPRYRALIEEENFPDLPPEHPGYEEEQAWLARKVAEAEANAPIRKIAVLPFADIMNDPEQEYFVDGMTEALITELAKIDALKVISRTSAMRYKETDLTMPEIAAELDVDGVVEGSVLREDDQVRITAQLIHGPSDTHRWAGTFDRSVTSVLKLHSELALAIANEVRANLTPQERARLATAPDVNARAYELYIEGRALWSERTPDGFEGARQRFEAALDIDPEFALAHAGLADVFLMLGDYQILPNLEAMDTARSNVEKALELDPNLAEAYATRGFIKKNLWDWEGSRSDFERAIELKPGNATARHWYGRFLDSMNETEEALRQVEIAFELDPFSPIIVATHLEFLADYGNPEDARARVEVVRAEFSDNARVVHALEWAYWALGRREDAEWASARAYDLWGGSFNARLERAFQLAEYGRHEECRESLELLMPEVRQKSIGYETVAATLARLGDTDEAFEWLELALEQRSPLVTMVNVWNDSNRYWGPLQSDPRFKAILDRMGFPESARRD